MRHRLVSGTGFGNPAKVLLNNKGKINKQFADEAIKEYFTKWDGFDYQISKECVNVGIEPGYQSDPLKIISINKDKEKSYIQTGKAWGPYGTQIAKNTKYYNEYKYDSKFIKFVDKWHEVLFGKKS